MNSIHPKLGEAGQRYWRAFADDFTPPEDLDTVPEPNVAQGTPPGDDKTTPGKRRP